MKQDEGAAWSIFGYLLSGLIFWGGAGWLPRSLAQDPLLPLGRPFTGCGCLHLPHMAEVRPRIKPST